jgi:hypothetical protein
MKSFKDFILEKRNYLFPESSKEWVHASLGFIPLHSYILKELERDITAYHVTDLKGLVKLKKYENKGKNVSAFTKGSSEISTKGVGTVGGVLVNLEGKTSIIFNKDAYTQKDRGGHLWLSRKMSSDASVNKQIDNIFSDKILKIVKESYKNEFEQIIIDFPDDKLKVDRGHWDDWQLIYKMIGRMSGKEKGKYVGFYMRESKKLLGADVVMSIVSHLENLLFVNKSAKDTYNEVLIHQYKIVNIYHYQTEKGPTLDEVKETSKSIGFRGKIVTKTDDFIAGITPRE